MNKTTEALKLAENTLRDIIRVYEFEGGTPVTTLAAIREALAEQEITTPDVCGEVCARAKLCYGCGKALDEANAKHEPLCEDEGCPHPGTPHICFSDPSVLDKPFACETGECPDKSLCAGACECLYKAEPVKQEPVGFVTQKLIPGFGWRKDVVFVQQVEVGAELYAAPVSAKREWVELTDDEIYPLYNEPISDREAIEFARAVITAFKEKNK